MACSDYNVLGDCVSEIPRAIFYAIVEDTSTERCPMKTDPLKAADPLKEISELAKKMQSPDVDTRTEARKRLITIRKVHNTADIKEAVTDAMRWKKKFDVELPSKQVVNVSLAHTRESVQRKVKVLHGYKKNTSYLVPDWRNVRDKHGEFVTAPVAVAGLRITVRFQDGTKLSARSCCKSPDVFSVKTAKRRAIHRLYLLDSGIDPFNQKRDDNGKPVKTLKDAPKPHLSGEDHKFLIYAILRNGRPKKVKKTASEKLPLTADT